MRLHSWFKWYGEDIVMRAVSKTLWPRTSAGTLVIEEDKLLALDLDSYLTLPIGGSDFKETFEETAIRETEEETGLEVETKNRIFEGINSNGGVEVLFSAEVVGGELDGNRIEGEPRWVGIEEAKQRQWRYNRDIEDLLKKLESTA